MLPVAQECRRVPLWAGHPPSQGHSACSLRDHGDTPVTLHVPEMWEEPESRKTQSRSHEMTLNVTMLCYSVVFIYSFSCGWVFGFLVVFAVTDNAAVSIPTRCPRVTCWVDQPRWPGRAAVTVTLSGLGPTFVCPPCCLSGVACRELSLSALQDGPMAAPSLPCP